MRRKNQEAHLWPLVNFSSQLKQRSLSLQLAISSGVSLFKGKGGGLAGEGKRGRFGGEGD